LVTRWISVASAWSTPPTHVLDDQHGGPGSERAEQLREDLVGRPLLGEHPTHAGQRFHHVPERAETARRQQVVAAAHREHRIGAYRARMR
jgi:hypothetical protein